MSRPFLESVFAPFRLLLPYLLAVRCAPRDESDLKPILPSNASCDLAFGLQSAAAAPGRLCICRVTSTYLCDSFLKTSRADLPTRLELIVLIILARA
ncbi:hypothetical protein NL676_024690 [Syzygium grande]|nr:hypothetical protein NL676_024690 [Syzygium grande]